MQCSDEPAHEGSEVVLGCQRGAWQVLGLVDVLLGEVQRVEARLDVVAGVVDAIADLGRSVHCADDGHAVVLADVAGRSDVGEVVVAALVEAVCEVLVETLLFEEGGPGVSVVGCVG